MGDNPELQVADSLEVLAIGNALVDVLARADDDLVSALGLNKGSMSLVDSDEAARIYGSLVPDTHMSGGSAANTAVGIASLGGRAGFIGRVADDKLGNEFARNIVEAGVVFSHQPVDDGSGTGHCTILVTPDAERTMATHLGAAALFDSRDIVEAMVTGAKVTYIEGYLWDLPAAKKALREAMDLAAGAGNLVALSLSDPFCVGRHAGEWRELLTGPVDIVFGNEEETKLLFGSEDFDGAAASIAATGVLGALTRGAKGSVVVFGERRVEVPAAPVSNVEDTTGAGDLFAAGFLANLTMESTQRGSELLRTCDLGGCAELGGICAAEIISHMGSRPLVSLADLARR